MIDVILLAAAFVVVLGAAALTYLVGTKKDWED